MKIYPWFLAIRPKTLTAAFVPVLVGTALVFVSSDHIKWNLSVVACLSALFIQMGTNLFNDALDFKKGVDTAHRLGPTRVTQSQLLRSNQVLIGATLCFAIAMLFAIPLVLKAGWILLVIGIVSLIFGYAYTGGPFPLSYLGFGDFFVLLFFGLIATGGVFFLHTAWWSLESLIAGFQIGFLATSLIAINNLRDIETDRRASKKTIPVRFGINFARKEISFLSLIPFLLNFFWLFKSYRWAFFLPFFSFPFVILLIRGIFSHPPGAIYNRFLEKAAILHLTFGLLLAFGFFLQ